MKTDEVKALIGQPEGLTLEYKVTLPPPGLVARIIAGFANSEGGWLLIGVRESREGPKVVGIPDDVPASSIVEAALSRLSPRPQVNHESILLDNGRIYVVEVTKSSTIITTENQSIFVRRGETIEKETPPEILPVSQTQPPICIKQVLQDITYQGVTSTEAKLTFLRQYRNLALIAGQSANILCPDGSDKPSKYPEGKTLGRLIYSSLVDTFERYVADVLIEIHLANPDTLKSAAQFSAKDILNCQNLSDIIRFMAEKKVGELSKGSSKEFGEYLNIVTKLDLFQSGEQIQADLIFATRNLYTHTNGIIDSKFIRNTNSSTLKVGDELIITLDELAEIFQFFMKVVDRLNSQAVKKYKLSTANL